MKTASLAMIVAMVAVAFATVPPVQAADAPIAIHGDAELAAQAAAYGWPGSGTAADPYRISGLSISGAPAVYVRNTTSHLIVASNIIQAAGGPGILIEEAANVQLLDNTIHDASRAIQMRHSTAAVVAGNRIENAAVGVDLTSTGESTISGNVVGNSTWEAVRVKVDFLTGPADASDNLTIQNNRLEGFGARGILARDASRLTVRDNVLEGDLCILFARTWDWAYDGFPGAMDALVATGNTGTCQSSAVLLTDVDGYLLEDNQFAGPVLARRASGTLANNVLVGDGGTGVDLENSKLHLTGNTIEGWDIGVSLRYNQGNTLQGNTFRSNQVAVTGSALLQPGEPPEYYPDDQRVLDNTFANNGVAFKLPDSRGHVITGNTFSDGETGLDLYPDQTQRNHGHTIADNTFERLDYAVRLAQTVGARVHGNQFLANGEGLYLSGSGQVYTNWFQDNGLGVRLSDGSFGFTVSKRVYNNYFDNVQNADSGTPRADTRWSLDAPRSGPNIVGGPRIGGNYWSDHAAPVDANGDGFGDVPYAGVLGGHVDFLPLVIPG